MPNEKIEQLFRSTTIDKGVDVEGRRVTLSFSSDTPFKRYDWKIERFYNEVLSHEPEAVDLTRLSEIGSVLVNHNSWSLPVGAIEKVWVEGGKGKAIVRFDDDEASEAIFQKVVKGVMRGVSVGYKVDEWDIIPSKSDLETRVATKWEPLEISIVSVPADATVGVGRSFDTKISEGGTQMAKEVEKVVEQVIEEKPDHSKVRDEGSRAERERVREIMEVCKRHEVDAAEHIDSGASIDEVRASILDVLAKKQEQTKVSTATVEVDERDKFRAGLVEGMAQRAGLKTESAERNNFAGLTFSMVADRCLERAGDHNRGNPLTWIGRAMSTSDFPYVCGAIANKAVQEGWNDTPETWTQWCGEGSVPDFKLQTLVGLGAFGVLPALTEGEEYKFTQRDEAAETVKIGTFGQMFALTRQTIINDDLSLFADTMRELGAAAKRTVAELPYKVLADNPAMGDGETLFHAKHGNLGTSAVVGIDSLNEGELKMSQQKDIGKKKFLGITPKFLIAPMSKKGHIRQFLLTELIGEVAETSGTTTIARPNMYNPWFQGAGLVPIYDHNLDGNAWFLAADKGKTVKVFFLNGVKTPYLENRDGWTVDGTEWKVRIDAAAAPVDWRGLFKNAGA